MERRTEEEEIKPFTAHHMHFQTFGQGMRDHTLHAKTMSASLFKGAGGGHPLSASRTIQVIAHSKALNQGKNPYEHISHTTFKLAFDERLFRFNCFGWRSRACRWASTGNPEIAARLPLHSRTWTQRTRQFKAIARGGSHLRDLRMVIELAR